MTTGVLLLSAMSLCIAANVSGGSQATSEPAVAKRSWEYTDAERLARRFDPASISERAAGTTGRSRVNTTSASAEDVPNVINGQRNPELFMPYELFMELLQSGVVQDRAAAYRTHKERAIATIANPVDFWTRLEAATVPYTSILFEEKALFAKLNSSTASAEDRAAIRAEIEVVQKPACAARAEALRAAAKAIGHENLYRVLYEVVGLDMQITSTMSREQMEIISGGCQ